MNSQDIQYLKNIVLKDDNVIALYDYGSTVYGTRNEQSDIDVIMVVQDLSQQDTQHILEKYMDVNLFSKEQFQEQINLHEITPLECIFLPDKFIWKKHEWKFNLSLPQLRTAISAKSSNSWVKAKKKFIVEKDFNPYIGKKSAWHTLRILDFGTQIAKEGKITDFSQTNALLTEILNCQSWEEIDSRFRKLYNEKSSNFKLLAPKETKSTIKNKM